MDVLIDATFAMSLLGQGHSEVPEESVEKFEKWIHALVQKAGKNDFNDI